MLVSLSDARFLRHGEMAVDLANTDPRQTAFELHEPENKAGVVIFAPALRSAWFAGKQYWVIVVGNCPTKRGGMGANMSKLFLGAKAAGTWLTYYSGVAVNVVIIDYSVEYAKRSRPRASPASSLGLTDPPGSILALRQVVRPGRQADRPPAARGHHEPAGDGALALRAQRDRGAEGGRRGRDRAERPLVGGERRSPSRSRGARRPPCWRGRPRQDRPLPVRCPPCHVECLPLIAHALTLHHP